MAELEKEHWQLHGPGSVRVCNGAHDTVEGCKTVAEAEILWFPREVAERRARLIAAAPDLLAACKSQQRAIAFLLEFLPGKSPEWLDAGDAAIVKAEGASYAGS